MNRAGEQIFWREPPPGRIDIEPSAIDFWRVLLPAHRSRLGLMHELLDDHERGRADSFRFEHLRERYILRHGLLRMILSVYLDVAPAEIELLLHPGGKPHVRCNSRPHIEFSLSDSDDSAIVAVTGGSPVGVDIEQVRRDRPPFEIVSEFAPDEQSAIESAESDRQRTDLLYRIWVRKEAFLKAHGVGLGVALNSFSVPVSDPSPGNTWQQPSLDRDADSCDAFDFDLSNDLVGCLVSCGPIGPLRFFDATESWILRTMKSSDKIAT